MAKNLLLNAQVSTMQDVYMIRYKDSGGTEHWYNIINKALLESAAAADVMVAGQFGGGGSGPSYYGFHFGNIDFSNKTEITHVGSSTSTTVYEAYPVVNFGVGGTYYYIENYNGYHVLVQDQSDYYWVQYSNENDVMPSMGPAAGSAPGLKQLMLKPDFWAEQIQWGSKSLTSVFPGVTYRVATDEVTFNPVYADPYTVEIYLSGSLLDTYVDCDKYYCNKVGGLEYNYIFESWDGGDGGVTFAMGVFDEYGIEYDPYSFYYYVSTIQYSTQTSGDSWTNIGYFRPFPDNVKRVKISIVEES